jgi:hypothetical protein
MKTYLKYIFTILVTISVIKFLKIQNLLTNELSIRHINNTINYSQNYKYVVNNNIAQYSSYILIDEDEFNRNLTYTIVVLVQYNFENVKDFGTKENFSCLIRSITDDKIMEIEAFHKPLMYDKEAGKLVFKFKSIERNDVEKMVIAVIWKPDYNKTINLNEFLNRFDEINSNNRVLPFDLIKYQIPTIIESVNSRLPSVGLCVHYTYEMPNYIINWIENNLLFGFGIIMFYDGTNGGELTIKIRNHFGENNKLVIKPYNMTFDSLCSPSVLFNQFEHLNLNDKIRKYLSDSCQNLFNKNFKDPFAFRSFHEQVTVNDCLTVLKEQYEFIANFDLDEFIFPRNYKNYEDFYEKNATYSCDRVDKICQLKVFYNSFKPEISDGTNKNYFYNYLMEIIQKEKKATEKISEMGSIYFLDSPFLIPDSQEKDLIENLGSIVKVDKELLSFPYKFNLGFHNLTLGKTSRIVTHTFIIEREDFSYVEYLYNNYKTFISCIYNRYLIKSSKINSNLARYLYYTAEPEERPSKVIYYYKHVNTIFIHRPIDFNESAWNIHVPYTSGHISHFRYSLTRLFKWNSTGSIRKLNIDFEYVFFLLQNYTNACDNHF